MVWGTLMTIFRWVLALAPALAILLAVGGGAVAQPAIQPRDGAARMPEQIKHDSWRAAMPKLAARSGCFKATYPGLKWAQVPLRQSAGDANGARGSGAPRHRRRNVEGLDSPVERNDYHRDRWLHRGFRTKV